MRKQEKSYNRIHYILIWFLEKNRIFLWFFLLTCMYSLFACMSAHHMWTWCLQRFEEAVSSPGTGVPDICELLWRCLELNPGSLKEQPELLTELFPALKTENWLSCTVNILGRGALVCIDYFFPKDLCFDTCYYQSYYPVSICSNSVQNCG